MKTISLHLCLTALLVLALQPLACAQPAKPEPSVRMHIESTDEKGQKKVFDRTYTGLETDQIRKDLRSHLPQVGANNFDFRVNFGDSLRGSMDQWMQLGLADSLFAQHFSFRVQADSLMQESRRLMRMQGDLQFAMPDSVSLHVLRERPGKLRIDFDLDSLPKKYHNQVHTYHLRAVGDSLRPGRPFERVYHKDAYLIEELVDKVGKKSVRITRKPGSTGSVEKRSEKNNAGAMQLSVRNLNLYANPTNGRFTLAFDLPEAGDLLITVNDMQGKEVYSEKRRNFSGNYTKEIDLGRRTKGTYVVRIRHDGQSISRRVVLQ